MLRDIYAPSAFAARVSDTDVSTAEKLQIISTSPVTVTPLWTRHGLRNDKVDLRLPFVHGAQFLVGTSWKPGTLYEDYINISDRALYQHGIGTRLVKAACRYAVDRDESITLFESGWTQLGAINLAVAVFGVDNVAVERGKRYGWQSDLPLEAVFDDFPPEPNKSYEVPALYAHIDRELALTWEKPVYTPPK